MYMCTLTSLSSTLYTCGELTFRASHCD
jgi:hypothetical protein